MHPPARHVLGPDSPLNCKQKAPPFARQTLPRPQLIRRLQEGGQTRLTVLCADAGYGKTTLLRDFCANLSMPVAWCGLGEVDRDPARFAFHLGAALRVASDTCVAGDVLASLAGEGTASADPLAEALLQGLLEGREEMIIVLDDYHRISPGTAVNAIVERLIDGSPPWVHFYLASRHRPSLPLSRWRARRELVELDRSDLALTPQECGRLMAKLGGVRPHAETLRALQERSGGWITALVLLCEGLRRAGPGELERFLMGWGVSAQSVRAYLNEEVLRHEGQGTRDFLLRISILERLDADVCNRLLAREDAGRILVRLEERGLFISRIASQHEWYRCSELMRDCLRDQLEREVGEAEERMLHQRAAAILAERREWAEAWGHLVKAGQLDQAASLLQQVGDELLAGGDSQAVLRWMRSLPASLVESRPLLLRIYGRAQLQQGNVQVALSALEKARHQLAARGERSASVWAICDTAAGDLLVGRLSKAEEVLEGVIPATLGDPLLRAHVLRNLARMYGEMGDLPRAIACGRAALAEAMGIEDEAQRVRLQCEVKHQLVRPLLRRGDMVAAMETAAEMMQFAKHELVPPIERAWAHCVMGAALVVTGHFAEALDMLAQAEEGTGRSAPRQRRWIAIWRGHALIGLDRLEAAEVSYGRAKEDTEREMALLCLRMGRPEEALPLAQRAWTRYAGYDAPHERGVTLTVVGLALAGNQQLEVGLPYLEEARVIFRAQECWPDLASLDMHMAVLALEGQRGAVVNDLLQEAFTIAQPRSLYHFVLGWDPAVIRRVCAVASERGICPSYVRELAARRLARAADGRTTRRSSEVPAGNSLGQPVEAQSVLATCRDEAVHRHLAEAVMWQWISAAGLCRLRAGFKLTWRELEAFVFYYLQPHGEDGQENWRRQCARELSVSENTMKRHLNTARRKTGLPSAARSLYICQWARDLCVTPASAR